MNHSTCGPFLTASSSMSRMVLTMRPAVVIVFGLVVRGPAAIRLPCT
jgi:hypothetical protein